jgi:GxxExxY protein
MDIFGLCDIVRQTGYELHVYLGQGHLEKVYENGLAHRLRKNGLRVEQQHPIAVYDEDGTQLGQYFADLFINDCLIVEVKAVSRITDEHIAQLLGYLKATRVKDGLLINFGAPKYWIRKFVM